MQTPEQLRDELMAEVGAADTLEALEALRVSALGKKGRITDLIAAEKAAADAEEAAKKKK